MFLYLSVNLLCVVCVVFVCLVVVLLLCGVVSCNNPITSCYVVMLSGVMLLWCVCVRVRVCVCVLIYIRSVCSARNTRSDRSDRNACSDAERLVRPGTFVPARNVRSGGSGCFHFQKVKLLY